MNNLETRFAFFNNQRMVTMTMKTIKVKPSRSKEASNRSKTKTIKMTASNSLSRKYSSCCNSKKTKEEVDRRKIRSKVSLPDLNHNLHLLKSSTLPPRNNFSKRRKKPAHPRVRVLILQ